MDTLPKLQRSPDTEQGGGDKNIEKNIDIGNVEQLKVILSGYGIDTNEWGKGEAKRPEDLFDEIQNKESVLVDIDGEILRKTLVTSILVKYFNNEGRTFVLREEHQGFHDGRMKERKHLNNISLAEKMHVGEDPKESAKRGIKEELSGFTGEINLRDLGIDETRRLSNSYPKLMSLFTVHRFEIFLTDEQFNPSGYVEVQPGKKNICFMWREENSENVSEFATITKDKLSKNIDLIIDVNQNYTQIQKEQFKENFKKALGIALEVHKDQKPRPDGPYINHILRVSNRIVEEYGVKDPELVISALLHDSVEDQSKKMSNTIPSNIESSEQKRALLFIKNTFGDRVAKIISKLSNPEEMEKEGLPLDERNKIYKEHIEETISDPDVFLIKLADFSDNALNLESVEDLERRLKLSKKYLPVIEVFINNIESCNILSQSKIEEIKNKLFSSKEKISEFIKSHT